MGDQEAAEFLARRHMERRDAFFAKHAFEAWPELTVPSEPWWRRVWLRLTGWLRGER